MILGSFPSGTSREVTVAAHMETGFTFQPVSTGIPEVPNLWFTMSNWT